VVALARRRTVAIAVLALAGALGLGACGSSASSNSSAPTSTPAGSHAATTTASTPASPSTASTPAPVDIYAADRTMSPKVAGQRPLIYVPNHSSGTVSVIDPATYKVINTFVSGPGPQHVVPSWDLQTLYVTNDEGGNSLTPIDPKTGEREGPNIPVPDPYNMYFTPDGKSAIVVAEELQRLDFRDPHTFALQESIPVNCAGIDHIDFSADLKTMVATCEFAGKLVEINIAEHKVMAYLTVGGKPQDIKLDPAGKVYYVADMVKNGVDLIDAATFRMIGFLPTGPEAHGLYVSRDSKDMYVANRGGAADNGSVSVIDMTTRKIIANWPVPHGTPDMGNVSADGKVLWLSGRRSKEVYAIDTTDGRLIARIPVGNEPHGLAVWPQPGNYSLGHTGIMR
jgi:YVTN family beta-propeller protein